ncbi:MAG TPA: YciI family protein [Candidatus Saccharimonadales bacterium]|nr:YciI family protein [Candidatus Saccharimonadales bacterium]
MLIFAGDGEDNDEKVMAGVGAWWGKYSQSGAIVGGERLQPSTRATTVRFESGASRIVDGPFAETKETIGGYAIVEVPDLDAALEMAKSWPASPAVEIRPIWVD